MLSVKVMRDLQSRFGFLLEAKYKLQRYSRSFRKRPFEPEFEILKYLKPNDRPVIDVGANQGQTIDAVRLYHDKTKIHSFEPRKQTFEKLQKLFKSDKNLVLYNVGLGTSVASMDIYVPYYRNFMYDGLSSFSQDRAANWLNEESVWRFNSKLLNVVRETCKIERLDMFKLSPSFLKIHVQGFELDVLEGATKTLREHLPVVLIANHAGANAWLRNEGWKQFKYQSGSLTEQSVNVEHDYNCIYLHPNNSEHSQLIQRLS